jgi:dolichol-phosphate mannosyltransferase
VRDDVPGAAGDADEPGGRSAAAETTPVPAGPAPAAGPGADPAGTDDELGRVLVIIPTYNEAENIEPIVRRVRAATPRVDILIADDNSPDGTGEIADRLAAADDRVHVMHRAGKEGLGAAYLAGFRWGTEREYDVLVEMDADGSHQPEELPLLLGALAGADLVIGARWVPGGSVRNWPKSREILSRGANTYTRLALGLPLRDATAGYRAFRRTTLKGIDLDAVASQGYCFQVDLSWRAVRRGFRVVEVPITFVERERGASKMSRDIVFEAFWRVAVWGARHRMERLRPGRN